ncbi:MAG: hypothetical protein PHH70_02920 [Candidatus Gracilibacteria bacterium]|nr:hypothetical protein [Candidatus Gracilibacteria bacterium]
MSGEQSDLREEEGRVVLAEIADAGTLAQKKGRASVAEVMNKSLSLSDLPEGLSNIPPALLNTLIGFKGLEFKPNEIKIFSGFFEKFPKLSPEIQKSILDFIQIVNTYILPESKAENQLLLSKNPLKALLFKDNPGVYNISSYKQWIYKIFLNFERFEKQMLRVLGCIQCTTEDTEPTSEELKDVAEIAYLTSGPLPLNHHTRQNVNESDIAKLCAIEANDDIESPECYFDSENLHIDSTGWNITTLEDAEKTCMKIKVNPEGDIRELPDGTQLFTVPAMIRETRKIGRLADVMSFSQAEWITKNAPSNLPEGCNFTGFIKASDTPSGRKLEFKGANAGYWTRNLKGSGDCNAILCTNTDSIDKPLRESVPDMFINTFNVKTFMQVRLVRRKIVEIS